eukprot:CAMPEP_0197575706 /NCGR_PEP_ID=MMETSP1326-20131121/1009_1 /TAXON_ID=1155430 /ORGANISM="Genus nov. species nov., Strain RCC2288" /LENGTH=257 /DNA_ID=CAMNT_0043138517 /DNA_START=203 /DNA_END=976 /DNA_ORIENTATION=+
MASVVPSGDGRMCMVTLAVASIATAALTYRVARTMNISSLPLLGPVLGGGMIKNATTGGSRRWGGSSASSASQEEEAEEAVKQTPADKAWDALYDLWVEVGAAFMPWWQAQAMDMRTSVLRTARDAVKQELGKAAVSMDTLCPVSMDTLCPEISDSKVGRLCADGVLAVLIDARLRDPESAEAHDERFAAANAVGPGHSIEVVVAASHNRSLLLLSTLFNVLVVVKQMGVLPAVAGPKLSVTTPPAAAAGGKDNNKT